MGTHRGDGRWTAPAGGHTRSVSSLGSPGAVPGVVWAFERFSAGASDAARFALFQTKPGNPEEFFRLPAAANVMGTALSLHCHFQKKKVERCEVPNTIS